jgi:hypothetical protein
MYIICYFIIYDLLFAFYYLGDVERLVIGCLV